MQEHEHTQELLAGLALRGLDEPDRAEADRLLSEHLPVCVECRDLLSGFEAVAGDLALAPPPVRPPDLLPARLRRSMGGDRARRRSVSALAVAAGMAAVIGMAALSVQSMRHAHRLEAQRGTLGKAVQAMSLFDTSAVPFQKDTSGTTGRMVGVTGPSLERMYLFGNDVPDPAPGNVYRLWLGHGGAYALGQQFTPEDGVVVLEVVVDPTQVDEVVVTEEPAIVQPTAPAENDWRWWSELPQGA